MNECEFLGRRSWAWMPFARPRVIRVKDNFFLFNNFYFSINVSKSFSCLTNWKIQKETKQHNKFEFDLTQKAKQLSLNIFDVNFVIFVFYNLVFTFVVFSSIFGFGYRTWNLLTRFSFPLYHFIILRFSFFCSFHFLFNYNYACI